MNSALMNDISQSRSETTSAWYINHYCCPYCHLEWQDEWDCTCNDKCPACNKEIDPYESDLVES
ncbi:hypothetical protein [Methylomonas sp. AM2-LC]|uniref:hypothetical protein n=1 Tax=Methylomonas sp. AM2-LC TaxID=3153301 RepID=UPI0032635502